MKQLLIILPVLILFLCACYHKKTRDKVIKGHDYKKAESFLYKQNDSAFYYFNKVVSGANDSLQIAMAYNNMAAIQSDASDYSGSQESLTRSLKFLNINRDKDRLCLSSDFNELGINSVSLKDYTAALNFYDLAIQNTKDKKTERIFLNNKALAYQKKKAYPQAIKIYQSILNQADEHATYSRILSNFAKTKWLQDTAYHAAPELLKALNIRKKENDLWGQNASYSHLTDYYTHSNPDSALFYAHAMYAVAKRLNSPDDQLEALHSLILLSPATASKVYFAHYQQINDSLQTARNAAKNQFALIRYDSEKNKAANLKLQTDNTEKRYQLFKQSILLYGILALLITISVAAVLWYRKRRQLLTWEAQNTIRENQLRISKKVHDVVANGLYRIMSQVENQEQLDKEALLDRIELLYEQSRDISYDTPKYNNQDFHKKIAELILSFATANIKVKLSGNSKKFWINAGTPVKYEIEHILQELMVNMKKHSRCSNVIIKFEEIDNQRFIYYNDDGIGFQRHIQHKNGLRNMENRIKTIRGSIIFDKRAAKGVKIKISFTAP